MKRICHFIHISMLLFALLRDSYARRRDSTRDTDVLSYEQSPEFTAAYRRAAVMVNRNVIPANDCYSLDGNAKKCVVSEFGNIATKKKVEASTTCGTPPNRYCNRVASPIGGEMRQCYICDANHIERMNPASYLIDSKQKSCWVSQTFNDSAAHNEAMIHISLEKKYELTYIMLQFCNKLPESMALYKSTDFGRKWVPLQFYSSQCQEMYNVEENGVITRQNEQAAICKNIYTSADPYTNTRIAFSLVEGRPSAHNLENSAVLRDWVTVTNIKVVFNRFSSPTESKTQTEDNYYSLSELTLGGRCKCNGHASKCTTDGTGNTKCECQHNTAGADCDRCKDFYFDRPWKLATEENANECIACRCNLHSSRCIFSSSLYEQSGKNSGGVCINCRHNTAGVHCQNCKEGFYRDSNVPMSHRHACKECKCHPYGSKNKVCGDNGQCQCKEGVTGQKCDRCKPGFSMTKVITSPCQRNPMTVRQISEPDVKDVQPCGSCRTESTKLDLRKYCNSVFAINAKVQNRETVGKGWVRFAIQILYVYKKGLRVQSKRARRDTKYIYVLEGDLHCKCPKLRVDKSYIMIGFNESQGQDGLLLDRESVVVRYNTDYDKRVKYYKKQDRKQNCVNQKRSLR